MEQRVTIAVPGAVPGAERVSVALAGESASRTVAVFTHGAGSGMDSEFMRVFHDGLAERGCLAVRFNFPYKDAKRKLPDRRPLLKTAIVPRPTSRAGNRSCLPLDSRKLC